MNVPNSVELQTVLTKTAIRVLDSEFDHVQFSNFFINQNLVKEDMDKSKIPCCFTQQLFETYIPSFTDGREALYSLDINDTESSVLNFNKTERNLKTIASI